MQDPRAQKKPAAATDATSAAPGATLDDLPDAFITIDGEGRIVSANRAACSTFGYPVDQLIGEPVSRLMPVSVSDAQRFSAVEASTAGGEPRAAVGPRVQRVIGRHREGARLPLDLRWSALGPGGHAEYAALARSSTPARPARPRPGHMETTELQAVNAELWVLYRISSALIRNLDMETLLSDVLHTITDLDVLNLEPLGGIFLVEGEYLRLAAHLGHSEEFLRRHEGLRVGECLCGIAARTGEVQMVENVEGLKCHTRCPVDGRHPHGHVIVPLKAQKRVVGVLYLYLPANSRLDGLTLKALETIGHQIGMAVDNARLYETTKTLALHDSLTGLANRRLMEIFLERNLARSIRSRRPFSLLMVDIDHFKRLNDARGHAAGDEALRQVARTISSTLRDVDLASRHGGEEFLVLLPETDLSKAMEVAERVRSEVAANAGVTVSIGVACCHPESGSVQQLIDEADGAMYEAKRAGRDRVVVSQASQRRAPDSADCV